MLTGQLIFREAFRKSRRDDHKIMMVCGIISVPNDFPINGEHQYVITGGIARPAEIHLHTDSEINLTDKLEGLTLDGMIKSPIWRV